MKIKSHYNVGGRLLKNMTLKLLEPIRPLFKDEVRNIGLCLGISKDIINRHPYSGPVLSLRIFGEVTKQKVSILQEADKNPIKIAVNRYGDDFYTAVDYINTTWRNRIGSNAGDALAARWDRGNITNLEINFSSFRST